MDLDSNRKLIAAALAAVGSGDTNALQTVYRLTATKLFAVCLRILGDRSEAEDVLQEIYMTVWSKAAAFDPALSSPMTSSCSISAWPRNKRRMADRDRAQPCHRPIAPGSCAAIRSQTCGGGVTSGSSAVQGASRSCHAATRVAKARSRATRCSAAVRSVPASTPSAYSAASSSFGESSSWLSAHSAQDVGRA
jgi:hypothetical protein